MSNGNGSKRDQDRLVPVATAALCLLFIGIGIIVWGYSKQAEYYRNADQHSAEYARNSYAPIADSCLKVAAESQFDCLSKATNEYRQYRRDEQDLASQKTSAIWAYLMGSAAIIGMILSAFGVFLVWTTFKATRESNDLFKEANRVLKDEQRPWLVIKIDSFGLDFGEGMTDGGAVPISFNIPITIKNVGKTPAFGLNVRRQPLVPSIGGNGWGFEFDQFASELRKERDSIDHHLGNALIILPSESASDVIGIFFSGFGPGDDLLKRVHPVFAVSVTYFNDGRLFQTANAFRISRKTAPKPIFPAGEFWGILRRGFLSKLMRWRLWKDLFIASPLSPTHSAIAANTARALI
jgi:hypothetical protein